MVFHIHTPSSDRRGLRISHSQNNKGEDSEFLISQQHRRLMNTQEYSHGSRISDNPNNLRETQKKFSLWSQSREMSQYPRMKLTHDSGVVKLGNDSSMIQAV